MRKSIKPLRIFLGCFVFFPLIIYSRTVTASTMIYEYTGNLFDYVQDTKYPSGSYKAGVDSITGYIKLANPLSEGESFFSYWENREEIISFAFNDGRETFDINTPAWSPGGSPEWRFRFIADQDGKIKEWDVGLNFGGLPEYDGDGGIGGWYHRIRLSSSFLSSGCFDEASIWNEQAGLTPQEDFIDYGQSFVPGSWRAVPEPATMLLFGAGLVGLAGFGRKRFRK